VSWTQEFEASWLTLGETRPAGRGALDAREMSARGENQQDLSGNARSCGAGADEEGKNFRRSSCSLCDTSLVPRANERPDADQGQEEPTE
jgi:hypothetical protein